MPLSELIAWAWADTARVHSNRLNLVIHLFAVPLFVLGHVAVGTGIVRLAGWVIVAGVGAIALSLFLQKRGHALEQNPSHPFANARDFVRRIYVEQFCNYWRFLFSGQLLRQLMRNA